MSEPSARARRIVADLVDSLPALLAQPLDAMLVELDDHYARRVLQAGLGASRDAWIESRRRLAEGRALFAATFFEGLKREALALMDPRAPQPTVAPAAPAQRRLSLVDADVLDEEGRLGAIGARHEHRASLPLLLLGQRFGVLLGRPPQDAAVLPVGPQAFGRALAGAARRAGLSLEARIALYTVYDMGFMRRFPEFAETMDASVDRAGVLPGLAFVPLRPRDVPGHAGRGVATPAGSDTARSAADAEATRIVNEAVARLRESGRVPEALASERRETIAAMTRYLLRHGQGSSEWKACVDTARSVLEAAARKEPPPPEARGWIEGALRSVGYGNEDARRLAEGLTSMQSATATASQARGAATRSAREQRCRERLAALSIGTQLGFSSRDGMVRTRLRYFYPEPGLLLLATEDGQEALFEIDAVARQMAEGQAWVIRSRPVEADAPAAPGDAASPVAPGADDGRPSAGRSAGA